jgi:uncharacterized membrane protein YfcA
VAAVVSVLDATLRIQGVGAPAHASISVLDAEFRLGDGVPTSIPVASVSLLDAVMNIGSGAPVTPNPASVSLLDAKLNIGTGGVVIVKTGAWAWQNGVRTAVRYRNIAE